MNFLFCDNPLNRNVVDDDYSEEFTVANELGHNVFLYNYEALTVKRNPYLATKRIPPSQLPCQLIYRGWILKPTEYASLYETLALKNYLLVNTPEEYQNCHYLPDSLKFIEAYTPKTIWLNCENGKIDFDEINSRLSVFDRSPIIVKDFVKSQKHYWNTACFIPDAGDKDKVRLVVETFLDWQGDDLNEGLVFREYVELADLTTHSKSGMPLKQEYRLFFYKQQLVCSCDYWEEGDYQHDDIPPTEIFTDIANGVQSQFFTMDVAKTAIGGWIIIELGDAQVAGLPLTTSRRDFYLKLEKYDT